ncbi:hypothetical protein SAMN05444392_101764 [Seinonella peptonophila]|uniref:YtkA-like n=1 Tax=Seinonella peptonophila TaxID=112248 RepID=A0A1M4U1W8_9BACL|nr:hypothetical protein [Seinonella peptonophila]SHE50673.1 hypothetical protein SAMN05444392_101764 [Seinonella peptonophila]
MKNKRSILIFSLATVFILAACNNTSTHQNHTQHSNGGEQENASAHQEHGKQGQAEHMNHQKHGQEEKITVDTQWSSMIQKADQAGEIRIVIKDKQGKPIPEFKINHEKKLHLIAVSEDLSYFDHLHPEWKGNGEFIVKTQFPIGGKYRLYADFIPQGGSQVIAKHDLDIQGETKNEPLEVEKTWTKAVDGKEITLQGGSNLKANRETQLTFSLKDERTKQPITNLQQYLGAVGHVVIISDDQEQYLHVHPLEEKAQGPDAKFATTFPSKGVYKIWGQFQHQGKVITVSYVVNVVE